MKANSTSVPRRNSSKALEDRLAFETLIADTSAALFAHPLEQMERTVERALDRVRVFFNADRCALLSVSADLGIVNVHLASYGEGVPAVPPELDLAKLFPWARARLLVDREPVRVSRVEQLPPEADGDRAGWEQLGVRSALVLPLQIGDRIRRLIVIQTIRRERAWPDALVQRLRVLGELLVGALERGGLLASLREAEARATLAADCAEAGLWILELNGRTFWATARARAMFGFSPDEPMSLDDLLAVIHPDDRGLVLGAVERALASSGPVEVEYRTAPVQGGVRWIHSRGQRRAAAGGQPERVVGVSMDVTVRKQAEEALRVTQARLTSGAELAGLGFYEVDYGARTAYADPRFRDVCGFPADLGNGLLVMNHWAEHIHPGDRARALGQRKELHLGRIAQLSIEYRFIHPTRGERWIHHLAHVSRRDSTGRVLVAYGVLRDITDQRRVEEERLDLGRRLIQANEEQRALLARELHDDVSQRLAVLAIDAGRAELASAGGASTGPLRAIREGLARLAEDVHSLAYQLHPAVLEELGLAEALRTACERLDRRAPLALSVAVEPVPGTVAKDVALCLFRVAQEALNNITRHAKATAASLTLRAVDGGYLLHVRDNGAGFDPAGPRPGRSLGLASMRERVRLLRGTLDIDSAPGRGTGILAWVPDGARAKPEQPGEEAR